MAALWFTSVLIPFIILFIYKDYVKWKHQQELIRLTAQFNFLRFWLKPYLKCMPESKKEMARIQLAEQIIELENCDELKKIYKFLFDEGKKV